NLEVLIPFYKEMDFNSFLGKLDSSFVEPEVEKKTAIDYIVATDLTEDMFSTDMSLYVEMLDENYHLSDVVGIAFGKEDRFYVTNDLAILDNEVFSNWISNEELSKKVFDTKRTEVA